MKYNVGDKVRVRKDLVNYSEYGGELFVRGMQQFKGKVVTICRLLDDKYFIREDTSEYAWTNEMLEGIANDAIKPDYYQFHGYDVFDIAKHLELDYPLGSALKYLLRAGHKDPAKKVEDLNKCIKCIKRHIELEG